jgi:hypothetical protein
LELEGAWTKNGRIGFGRTRCFKLGIQYIIYVRKLALLTGLVGRGKGGAILRAQQNKDFGAIPYFLVIADYEKAFLYVVLK